MAPGYYLHVSPHPNIRLPIAWIPVLMKPSLCSSSPKSQVKKQRASGGKRPAFSLTGADCMLKALSTDRPAIKRSKTKRKTALFKRKERFLELIGRFELPTSSLPNIDTLLNHTKSAQIIPFKILVLQWFPPFYLSWLVVCCRMLAVSVFW